MKMNKEDIKKVIDKNISELFTKLINQTPAAIDGKTMIYNLDGELVELSWHTKREQDKKITPKYLEYAPFEGCSNRGGFFSLYAHDCFTWEIVSSKELEGFSFFIKTKVGTFTVPELTRRELVEVQEKIEEYYSLYEMNFLNKLVKSSNFGTVCPPRTFNNWEIKG